MKARNLEKVLAIYPITRGFGFALFEGESMIFDWGVRHVGKHEKNERCLLAIEKLILRYDPHLVVIEDVSDPTCRRTARIHRLYRELERLTDRFGLPLYAYPWPVVFRVFEEKEVRTRHDISVAIAGMYPCLKRRLPPKRKIWLPTDPRQSLFDAVALGLTHYRVSRPKPEILAPDCERA